MIRDVLCEDAASIAEIYNHYIKHSTITFEEETVSPEEMKERILEISTDYPYMVYEEGHRILGYCYASKWRARSAYRFTLESTVYLDPQAVGQGIGSALYKELIQRLKDQGVHSIIGGIALPNIASMGLHKKLGFRKVAHFSEVGFKLNQWIDVVYWELLLNKLEKEDGSKTAK